MSNGKAIGAIEFSSVGLGYMAQDEMLKAGSVNQIIARTICSGKYLVVVGGSVSDVEASIAAGVKVGSSAVIDELTLANVHESVFPALGQSVALHARRGRRAGRRRNLQRREHPGRGRPRRQGRAGHALPHPRGDGPGRQGPAA